MVVRRVLLHHGALAGDARQAKVMQLQALLQRRCDLLRRKIEIDVSSFADLCDAEPPALRRNPPGYRVAKSCPEIVCDEPRFHALVLLDERPGSEVTGITEALVLAFIEHKRQVRAWDGSDDSTVFRTVTGVFDRRFTLAV